MGLRFRKSINFGGIRINLSKTGIGYSVGTHEVRTSPSKQKGKINKPIKANDDIVDIGINVEYMPKRGILGTYKKR